MADVVGYNKHENGVIAVSLIGKHERKLVWVHHFRPLRTEREKAIDEMAASIGAEFKFEGYDLHTKITRSLSEFIYDAGYRKVKS